MESAKWSLVTNHASVLFVLANQPDLRIADLANTVGLTQRTATKLVADLEAEGYLMKERVGRRNRYQINMELSLRPHGGPPVKVKDLLHLFNGG